MENDYSWINNSPAIKGENIEIGRRRSAPKIPYKDTLTDEEYLLKYGLTRDQDVAKSEDYMKKATEDMMRNNADSDRQFNRLRNLTLAGIGGGVLSSSGLLGGTSSAAGGAGSTGSGTTAFTAMTPAQVYAGGLGASNAAVAGMGGAAGIGAAGAGSGLLGGGNSIAALTPEAVQAGGTAAATNSASALTPQAIGSAGGALNVAPAGVDYLGQAQKGLKAASTISGLLGGGQGQGGGMGGDSTRTNQIDPRMAKYIYGDENGKGILDLAKGLYDNNPDGMNDQMRQGLNSQWNFLNDPALKQGYQHISNTGLGLMSMPIAGNPFTNGMGGRPQAMQSQQMPQFNPSSFQGLLSGGQPQQDPFSLMQAGNSFIPYAINNPKKKVG
jgi:hypothetical protein